MNELDLGDPGLVIGDDGRARPVWANGGTLLREYYDNEWGMPVTDEIGVFERLSLEGFQSGLSWATILRKRPDFRRAFAGFVPEEIARFTDADIARLLDDASIVRNRLKINATIANAAATIALRERGGLAKLIWSYQPDRTPLPRTMSEVPTQSADSAALAKELRRSGFRFVGPTTMFALMEALGIVNTHLIGSHRRDASGIWASDGTALRRPADELPG